MKSTLSILATVITVCCCTLGARAQQIIPYLPPLQDFGGSVVSDLSTFSPSIGDYTLEVGGTTGTLISIGNGFISYTPDATGAVRFVQKNGKVYVYEGNAYKTTLTPDRSVIIYPNIFTEANNSTEETGIYNPANLLQNPGFETIPNSIWKCYDHTPANVDITNTASSGTSIRTNNLIEGNNALLFHRTAQYLTQSLPAGVIKPNTYYKLAFKYRCNDASQSGAVIRADLGTSERGTDIVSTATRTTQNNTDIYDFIETFSVGNNVSEDVSVWFLVQRTSGANASQQKLEWYDNFTLVEGNKPAGITGASEAIFLDGSAYAPEIALGAGDYFDCTEFIVNPSFEDNFTGWTNNGFVRATNSPLYTKDGSAHIEKYVAPGGAVPDCSVSQTISDLPNGKYKVLVGALSRINQNGTSPDDVEGAYLFANEVQTPVSTANDAYEVTVIVADGTITIGFKAENSTANWISADNFRLYYYGIDLTALTAAVNEKLTIATAAKTATDNPGYINASELDAAITQANTAVAGPTETGLNSAYNALLAAISNYNAIIDVYAPLKAAIARAEAIPVTYAGYTVFQTAIAVAKAVYSSNEDQTSNIAEAITDLRAAEKTYILTQTAPADITPVIDNPDFEEEYTEFAKPNSDRAIYQPSGWTAEWTGGNVNDQTFNSTTISQDNKTWSAYEGQSYFTRQRWTAANDYIQLTQALPTLPAGVYELKFQGCAFGTNGASSGSIKAYVTIGETTVDGAVTVGTEDPATWAEYAIAFTLESDAPVTIGLRSTKLADNLKAGYDHFTLHYYGLDLELNEDTTFNESVTLRTLTINAGKKLTVAEGVTLTVAELTLKSDANGTATLVNNGTLSVGTANVEQYLATGTGDDTNKRQRYYLASPVNGAASTLFGENDLVGDYNEATASYSDPFIETTTLVAGKGYVVNLGSTDSTYTFSGALNDGAISVPVTCTGTGVKSGFNLVGNPYPSYLDWDNVTKTNVQATIWTRSYTNSQMQFYTYNADAQVGTESQTTAHIAPLQAFWIRVPSEKSDQAGLTLEFTNTSRLHKGEDDGNLRASQAETRELLRLQVSNGTNSDNAVILFDDQADNAFDSYDSEKWSNENPAIPEIYTWAGTTEVAINTLAGAAANRELALGFRTGTAGTFSIAINTRENIEEVILIDRITGEESDLVAGAYEFTSDVTDNAERFVITFRSSQTVGLPDINARNWSVYSNVNRQITVAGAQGAKLSIFSLSGQKQVEQTLTGTSTVIDRTFDAGVYLVKINGEVRKIIVR
jgi:hypothetical protein